MKVNAGDTKLRSTSELVDKTQYDSDKQNLEKKIEDVDTNVHNTSGLVKDWLEYKNYRNWKQNASGYQILVVFSVSETKFFNSKFTEIEKRIPNISGFGTTANFNTESILTQNKIPEITNLITKVALNPKIIETEDKTQYITNLSTKAALNIKVTQHENKVLDNNGFITIFIATSRVKKIAFKCYGCPNNIPKIEKLCTFQQNWKRITQD